MNIELTVAHRERQRAFRAFVEQEIVPHAEQYDETERFPRALIEKMAASGYLGAVGPAEYGGLDLDPVAFGLLCEELGRGCASARSLLTVHSMAFAALLRWGNPAQKTAWAPRLSAGRSLIAFALTEPEAGSDAASLSTRAVRRGDGYHLDGCKRWISFGQVADLFLLFARLDGEITAFLVERSRPGLSIVPIGGLGGCRASMLAELRMIDCVIPAESLVGRPGLGWRYVASLALDHGRFSVACGCVGLAQACLEASLSYANQRRQFGVPLADHPLIQAMLAEMGTGVEAARLLCYRAAYLRQTGDAGAVMATSMAKYFAAGAAARAAADAVQIHGANGFSRAYPVQRHWRDAKIMEVIEGSTQIQQMVIARALARQMTRDG